MARNFHGVTALFALLTISGGVSAQVVGHPEPLSQLASDDPALAANKQLVFDLWRGIVNAGHVELADDLLAEGYIQHSPVLPTGRAAFKQIFSAVPRREEIPAVVEPPLVALVAEGPYVVMALAETLAPPDGSGNYTTTHFNLFRIENGRLAEHWHSVQTPPGPDVAAPEDGGPQPVTGVSGTDQYALLESSTPTLAGNKRLVFDVSRQIVDAGREELAGLYFAADFVDRSPNAAPSVSPFGAYGAETADRPIGLALRDPLVAMVAEGDLVVQVTMHEHPHPMRAGATYTTTGFEMFRVTDDRIVEHWDPSIRNAVPEACAPDGDLGYLCGLSNAEDIVGLGDGRWLVASSITTRGETVGSGQLYLIDAESSDASVLFPGASPLLRPDAGFAAACPSLDLAAFDTHGLALRETGPDRYRLYATSHGAVEAIQIFAIDAGGDRPAASWIGCVPLPSDIWANSVAILEDGGFVTTQFMDPTDPESIARVLRGEPNGSVFEWHPGGAVTAVPGTSLSGPNGIELSPDGRYLFVADFGGHRVVRFERGTATGNPQAVALDISPDNLRWTDEGTLLTAGSHATPGGGWSVYEIEPLGMTATRIAGADQDAALQAASTALKVGGRIWIGTPGGDRIGFIGAD